MKFLSKGRIILIVTGILACAGIFMLPLKSSPPSINKRTGQPTSGIKKLADSLELHSSKKTIFITQRDALKNSTLEDKINAADSLVKLWLSENHPGIAALYSEEKAKLSGDTLDWFDAGIIYYKASKFSAPEFKDELLNGAIRSFNKNLEINPGDLKAKTSLAVCYVENGMDPMKGIGLLKEVLEKDPVNIPAHMNLGYFSIQSGQFEKAAERFEKVLSINPEMLEAYLYLGESYASLGKKEKAIENLESYKQKSKDEAIKEQVDSFIKELKTS